MSDKKDAKPAEKPAEGAEAAKKKGLPIKTIGIVAAVMIVEAVAVFMVFKVISPKPTHAAQQAQIHNDDGDTPKEIKVVEDKFQNIQQTESWMWQITVAVKVKKRHAAKVEELLKAREAEIKDEIRKLVGKADHNQLKEPNTETLNRQITALLNQVIPVDERTNEPLIEKVLIPKCFGVASDY